MIVSIASASLLVSLLWWLVVILFCVTLFRNLRLPALPWIALAYAVALVAVPFTQYYMRQITATDYYARFASRFGMPGAWAHSPLGLVFSVTAAFDQISDLLLVLLAFSEIAVLVTRGHPEVQSRLVRFLASLHPRVRAIGIAAVVLGVLLPVPAMIYVHTAHPQ